MAAGQGNMHMVSTIDTQGPQNLLDVLSEIEQFSVAEKMGSPIPEEALTTKHLLSYSWIGFMRFVKTVLVTVVPVLLFCWANEGLISVFGSYRISMFDRIFITIFALALPISTAFLVSRILWRLYIGSVTQKAILYLGSGIIGGTVLMSTAVIIFTHQFFYRYFTPEAIAKSISSFPRLASSREFFFWLNGLSRQTITAGYMTAFFCLLSVLIITASFFLGKWRTRKINQYKETWQ